MQTNIVKWGNSQGIRIPKAFLRNIQVSENEPVDVILEREKIIIKKINAKKHKTTRERLVEFYGAGFSKKHRPKRIIDWGKPVGKEIW